MEASKSPAGSVKRHSRNVSYARPRRSTRGPLDEADDPLAAPPRSPSLASPLDATSPRQSTEHQRQSSDPEPIEKLDPSVDLSFLKGPSSYHRLSTEDVPAVFVNSNNQPPSDTQLSDLIQQGHFRRAAETALIELSRSPSDAAKRILQLLYTRLACLVLISRADLASVEAASLTDYLARDPPGASDLVPVIPWELRLLLVRLQSIAAADGGRRGIMALYALTAEVRAHLNDAKEAGNKTDVLLWGSRLSDLGLRVADTLVEMGELETATRHLDSLVKTNDDELAYRKALLRMRVGDVTGARRSLDRIQDAARKTALDAMMEVANGNFSEATHKWQSLVDNDQGNALFASNLAVGFLYTGNVSKARQTFEQIAEGLPTFPGLLFNLGTVYELCTEYALERKNDLAARIAAKAPSPISGGWERANFEFKL